MNLTKKQKTAIVGMILGDGYLQQTGKINARLRLEHRAEHYDYLTWKANLLPALFQSKAKIIRRIHPITRKTYYYARHQSNASPYLGKMRKIFYPDGRKHIPNDLSRWLREDIGFAIWYYDDGYYYRRDRCFYLYLGKTDKSEAEIASKAVKSRFNLVNSVLDKKNKGFALYFPPTEKEKIKKIVEKYPVPVMAYKIPS